MSLPISFPYSTPRLERLKPQRQALLDILGHFLRSLESRQHLLDPVLKERRSRRLVVTESHQHEVRRRRLVERRDKLCQRRVRRNGSRHRRDLLELVGKHLAKLLGRRKLDELERSFRVLAAGVYPVRAIDPRDYARRFARLKRRDGERPDL